MGHCEPGRRLAFVFWGSNRPQGAEDVLRNHLAESAPNAVVWSRQEGNLTVVVPEGDSGQGVVDVARRLKLKIAREDFVQVSPTCELQFMNHGVDLAALATKPENAGDAAPSASAPPPDPSGKPAGPKAPPKIEPTAESKACEQALEAVWAPYAKAVDHQTSIASTRMLLGIFGKACAPMFPELAKAADKAKKVGRKERSRLLAEATSATCAKASGAASAADVVADCPPVEGQPDLPVYRFLDAGTYSFVQALKRAGMKSNFTEELMLQASLHPELDK
jgi:hypothetical protein